MYGTVATPERTFHCIALPLTAKEAGQPTSKRLFSIIKSQFSKRKNPLRSLLANAPNGAYLLLWLLLCWMAVGLWCPPPTLAMLRLDLGERDLPHTSSREIPPKTPFWLSIYVPYIQVKKENLWHGLYFPPCCEGLAALPSKHHQWPPDFNSHVSAQLFPAQFPWSVPVERHLVFLFQTPAGQTMLRSPPTHQCSMTVTTCGAQGGWPCVAVKDILTDSGNCDGAGGTLQNSWIQLQTPDQWHCYQSHFDEVLHLCWAQPHRALPSALLLLFFYKWLLWSSSVIFLLWSWSQYVKNRTGLSSNASLQWGFSEPSWILGACLHSMLFSHLKP